MIDWQEIYNTHNHSGRLRGYYNHNYTVVTSQGKKLLRVPIKDVEQMDLRMFPESRVLQAVKDYYPWIPHLVYADSNFQVFDFIEGHLLEANAPRSSTLPDIFIQENARLFHALRQVPTTNLAQWIPSWAREVQNFYRMLQKWIEHLYTINPLYHSLFEKFGIKTPLFTKTPSLHQNQHCLLHGDVHRRNCLIENEKVWFIDWELSLLGDPIYDLAVSLHKSKYPLHQESKLLNLMNLSQLEYNNLLRYRELENAKSLIVDLVRFQPSFTDPNVSLNRRSLLAKDLSQKIKALDQIWSIPFQDPESIFDTLSNYKLNL
jgi:aminoglycoside phosphotransferase (APT) family kinase protein